jgi:type I restriction enzyme S subunit
VPWKNLERWSVEFISRTIMGLNSNNTGKYKSLPLSKICIGQSGGTPSKSNKSFWMGSIPWVSPKDMKTFEIFDAQDHISEQAIKNSSAPLIKPNSILVVVRSGILQKTVPIAINRVPVSINQDIRAFTLLDDRFIPDFVANYLQLKQDELLRLVKWSTTVQSINKEEIEALILGTKEITC